jgi:oligopeptide/dipeptide ABC transporter ATP-binding protein
MTAIVEVEDLVCEFPLGPSLRHRLRGHPTPTVRAVDHVSISAERGTALGIVGESGCGKTTLARAIVGLQAPTSGTIRLDGEEVGATRSRAARRRIQMVFQDPGSSLNPKMTIGSALGEMVRSHHLREPADVAGRCRELARLVELPESVLEQRPGGLSGGQRQRAAIARALAVEPDVLVADEAVAALDVSVQAAILNLLNDLRARLGLTIIFISHDLGVVRQVTDRVAVCYFGRIVEEQPTDALFERPRHPYTRALMAAAPRLDHRKRPGESALPGDVPRATNRYPGCAFQPRCPLAIERCAAEQPSLRAIGAGAVACHVLDITDPAARSHQGSAG